MTNTIPEKFDFTTKSLVGLAVLGTAFNLNDERSVNNMTMIVTGAYDLELKCASASTLKIEVKTVEDLEHIKIQNAVKNMKDYFRNIIREIFTLAEEQYKLEHTRNRDKLLAKLRQTNKPHAQGTVAEIAAKYGMSKSEVRRHKADGTLDSVLFTKGMING